MELGSVETLALDAIFGTMSVPATVTLPAPDDSPILTTVVWLTPQAPEFGTDLLRREPQRILALRLSTVASVPRGTLIVAPERSGGMASRWRVDGLVRSDAYETRVIVVADPEPA